MIVNREWRICFIMVFVLLCAAFAFHQHVDRKYGKPLRELSKMMSVRHIAGKALLTHYKERGSFPLSLSELPLQTLGWGDEGSSPQDLDVWRYKSYGQNFTLAWTNSHGGELFLGGRSNQLFFSREEVR